MLIIEFSFHLAAEIIFVNNNKNTTKSTTPLYTWFLTFFSWYNLKLSSSGCLGPKVKTVFLFLHLISYWYFSSSS
nr:hypothetical protein CFP56_15640 [Quercus suber]